MTTPVKVQHAPACFSYELESFDDSNNGHVLQKMHVEKPMPWNSIIRLFGLTKKPKLSGGSYVSCGI